MSRDAAPAFTADGQARPVERERSDHPRSAWAAISDELYQALLDREEGDRINRALHALQDRTRAGHPDPRLVALGLMDGHGELTPLGVQTAAYSVEALGLERGIENFTSPEIIRSKRVADLGCGRARYYQHFLDQGAASYIGVDLLENASVYASILAARYGRSTPPIIKGSIEDTGLPSESVDVVVIRIALQYTQVGRALREARRILAPGGKLIMVCVTFETCWKELWCGLRQGNVHAIRNNAFIALNSLVLQTTGRQITVSRDDGKMFTKHSPTNPTRGWLERALRKVGFGDVRMRERACGIDVIIEADR
jgi:ubiquinone/menaquinone biosynthesis C-methylase UbiE